MEQNLGIFLQISIAAFLGSLVGIERAVAGKTAGLRTFALVSMGSGSGKTPHVDWEAQPPAVVLDHVPRRPQNEGVRTFQKP